MLNYKQMILQISPDQYPALLPFFPDTPENVHVRYFLTKRLCEIYLTGNISNPQAIIIRSKPTPSELFGYQDPSALFQILKSLENWHSILVNNDISETLGRLISQTKNITYEKEIYLVLKQPVTTLPTSNVRQLTFDDTPILLSAQKWLQAAGSTSSYQEMLSDGIVVGIIVNNQLASIAYATHITEKFADVGTFTSPNHRNKGYSTSAAMFLIQMLQAKNLTPVWSTDENNSASLKIAQKLRFTGLIYKMRW
ncbi:MAG: hypothetical protein G01um101416_348 [Microgenomates group bacterium Gr01-1014_16]|nr:MAG: hypothetical protein G01um101416_348 [Microgenomates group bacterium Gr01-1014_16]